MSRVTVHKAPFYDFCLSLTSFFFFFEGDIREKKNNTQSNHLFVSSWSAYLLIVK